MKENINEERLKKMAESIKDERTLIQEINRIGNKYLVTYNYQFDKSLPEFLKKGNQKIMDSTKKYYEFLRKMANELGADISRHPERLEELTE